MLFCTWTGGETLPIGPSIQVQDKSVQKLAENCPLHIRRKMPVSPPPGQHRVGVQAPKAFELAALKSITVFWICKVLLYLILGGFRCSGKSRMSGRWRNCWGKDMNLRVLCISIRDPFSMESPDLTRFESTGLNLFKWFNFLPISNNFFL